MRLANKPSKPFRALVSSLVSAVLVAVLLVAPGAAPVSAATGMPPPPPVCPTAGPPALDINVGCRIDLRWTGPTPPKAGEPTASPADRTMSISVPPVLVVGQPFTISVHSDVPQRLCPTVSKTPVSNCMLFWDIGLRSLGSGGLTDPFASNNSFPNAQCPLAMGGYNGSHGPFYPTTKTSMSCRTAVQIPPFLPNPAGQWWLLGAHPGLGGPEHCDRSPRDSCPGHAGGA